MPLSAPFVYYLVVRSLLDPQLHSAALYLDSGALQGRPAGILKGIGLHALYNFSAIMITLLPALEATIVLAAWGALLFGLLRLLARKRVDETASTGPRSVTT